MKNNNKHIISLLVLMFIVNLSIQAQDIPLFSQKLSNSFIYNPSIAGQQYGSVTLAHRSIFSKVEGSARDVFFSAHKPFFDKNIGVGINIYNEKVNFMNNVFVSGAFAYHLQVGENNLLSFGLSGEMNSLGFDRSEVIGEEQDDLIKNRLSRMDFSTGASFLTPDFEVGASVNRMASLMDLAEEANLLSAYYSLHYKHKIRLGDGLVEPMVNYRRLSSVSNVWSVGGFYTYNNLLLGGMSYQSSKAINLTLGGKVKNIVWAGISYQMQVNSLRKDLGGSTEFVVRYDIDRKNEVAQKSHFKKSKTAKKSSKNRKKTHKKNKKQFNR